MQTSIRDQAEGPFIKLDDAFKRIFREPDNTSIIKTEWTSTDSTGNDQEKTGQRD
jgi:hypothetical protein